MGTDHSLMTEALRGKPEGGYVGGSSHSAAKGLPASVVSVLTIVYECLHPGYSQASLSGDSDPETVGPPKTSSCSSHLALPTWGPSGLKSAQRLRLLGPSSLPFPVKWACSCAPGTGEGRGPFGSFEVQEPRGEAWSPMAARGQSPPMCFLQRDLWVVSG